MCREVQLCAGNKNKFQFNYGNNFYGSQLLFNNIYIVLMRKRYLSPLNKTVCPDRQPDDSQPSRNLPAQS